MSFPQQQIERLVRRLLAGEVVFFVGSGFSIDSERNSATALIARLLARFEALSLLISGEHRQRCDALRNALRATFRLKQNGSGGLFSWANVGALARDYYNFNDWICTAFADLLGLLDLSKCADLGDKVSWLENRLLIRFGERRPIRPINFKLLADLNSPRERGKVLFLNTMGFDNPEVMAGRPLAPNIEEVRESFRGRLRPRHRVLAQLAREGVSSTLLTTNYDLLAEGAYREAGMVPQVVNVGIPPPEKLFLPPSRLRQFSRIADALHFFGRGEDHATALILKIHGCAEVFRQYSRSAPDLAGYLPSIVFTFREIQNWREDSWSRDLLRTLLRTRTIVFCGYSGADPVIHDTFRSVYEEMGERRRKRALSGADCRLEDAPAFFLGLAGKREFYGLEILRSAGEAVGAASLDLTDHPNYIQFYPTKDRGRRFPVLDELMRWLYHGVTRSRQQDSLDTDLRTVASALLGNPPAKAEIEIIQKKFKELRASEASVAERWTNRNSCRASFERVVGWTEGFHAGLLREIALADVMFRSERPANDFRSAASWPWYSPMVDHPDRVAWGVVVELALRRLLAVASGEPAQWASDSATVSIASDFPPSVSFCWKQRQTPVLLSLKVLGPGRPREGSARLRGAFSRQIVWELPPKDLPWPRKKKDLLCTPSAREIWRFAIADVSVAQARKALKCPT
ncbi:MAG TPA: SIR2 family protein [Thermoanaerobaculia bacterium]|jgi:hypothetical protein|nr:SIR2 family protein [Thermoanaerobaculia bacterium]